MVRKVVEFVSHSISRVSRRSFHSSHASDAGSVFVSRMSEQMAFNLADVVKCLNEFASPSLAESWDNVGLLVEPPSPQQITKILLTNDLTEDVLEETLQCGAQCIVSYHPPIFAPLKSITNKSWKERIVGKLLENKIALYSPHTSWDSVQNGVNDWLARAFGEDGVTVEPINQHFVDASSSHTISATFNSSELAQKCIHSTASFLEPSSCRFFQNRDETNFCVEIQCSKRIMPQLIPFMNNAGNFRVMRNDQIPLPHYGTGRKVNLSSSISLQSAVNAVKNHLNLKDVSVAIARGKTLQSPVNTVVLCAGSGASVLKGLEADLYLTGEMLHHDVLDAVHRGTHIILTRHSNSERGFLHTAAQVLHKSLPGIDIIVSQQDRDPLTTV